MEDIGKIIGKNIGVLCRQLNLYINHELSGCDVTASEMMYLGSLFLHDGVTQEELAEEFCVDKAAVARTLCALEGRNIIYRSADENDRRSKRVFLTKEADKYKSILTDIQNRWYRETLGDLEPAAIESFAETLSLISDNARKTNETEKKREQ